MSILFIVIIAGVSLLVFFLVGCQQQTKKPDPPEPEPTPKLPKIEIAEDGLSLVRKNTYSESRVIRWPNNVFSIYNATGSEQQHQWLQDALITWNRLMPNTTFVVASEEPAWATVTYNPDIYDFRDANGRLLRAAGLCYVHFRNFEIYKVKIELLPTGQYPGRYYEESAHVIAHELGHGIGFRAHTSDPACVMNCQPGNLYPGDEATLTVRTMYALNPGSALFRGAAALRGDGEVVLVDEV